MVRRVAARTLRRCGQRCADARIPQTTRRHHGRGRQSGRSVARHVVRNRTGREFARTEHPDRRRCGAERAGHEYRPLGHSIRSHLTVEPYLITLTDKSEIFRLFQHAGVEFLYILAGEVLYRHARKTYHLKAGDRLFFDADAAHGPEELISLPVKMIAVLSRAKEGD